MYLADVFTTTLNLAGNVRLSACPAASTAGGLPIGLQLIGPHLGEEMLLRTAHAYEQTTRWHTLHPET
jgi:aspartyl-tRNA(Asn)/glutamyl-tRNA(Gln) amidotransferase subunit A